MNHNLAELQSLLDVFVEQLRPPEHIRAQLDIGARINGNTVEIFETRPQWDSPSRVFRYPVARATWQERRALWRVFCLSDDLTWCDYPAMPTVDAIEVFLEEVRADRLGLFWGG